jgi:hypothetical protein
MSRKSRIRKVTFTTRTTKIFVIGFHNVKILLISKNINIYTNDHILMYDMTINLKEI